MYSEAARWRNFPPLPKRPLQGCRLSTPRAACPLVRPAAGRARPQKHSRSPPNADDVKSPASAEFLRALNFREPSLHQYPRRARPGGVAEMGAALGPGVCTCSRGSVKQAPKPAKAVALLRSPLTIPLGWLLGCMYAIIRPHALLRRDWK